MPPPDSGPLTGAIEQALHVLRAAAMNTRMYPKKSAITRTAIRNAQEAVTNLLKTIPEVMISDTGDGLLLNGTKTHKVNRFRELMAAHKIRNLRLRRGVTPDEVEALCSGLGRKIDASDPGKNIIAFLREQGVRHIEADDIRYIDVKGDERVVLRGKGEVSLDEASNVAQSLKNALNRIEQVPDSSVRPLLREEVAKEVAEMTPAQLLALFTQEDAGSGAVGGLLQNVTESLPLKKVEDIFRYVVERQEQIQVQIQSETDRAQRMSLLRAFMRQVLSAPASREIPPELYAYLSSLGLLESAPSAALKGGEHFTFAAVAKNLLALPGGFLVTEPLLAHMLELVKTLCARGSDVPLRELLDKILQNLESFDEGLRAHTVEALAKLHGILITYDKTEFADRVLHALSTLADAERTLETYKGAAVALVHIALDEMVRWRYDQAASIANQLRRHSQEDYALPEGRHEQARQALLQFAERSIDALCSDLSAAQADEQRGALRVVIQFGEFAVDPLIEVLRRAPGPRAHQAVFQALELLGPAAHAAVLERIQLGESAKLLVQLIPLIAPDADAAILPKLTALFQHPDGAVRAESAFALAQRKERGVTELLLSLVNDPEPLVLEIVVRRLGRLRHHEAAGPLIGRLESAPPAIQEEICIALDLIHNPAAIPALSRVLKARRSFWSRVPLFTEAVRVRAASGLAHFLGEPPARLALETAAKDSSPLVRQIALQILHQNP